MIARKVMAAIRVVCVVTVLKVVCAWCTKGITKGAAYPVSHGLCDACATRQSAELKVLAIELGFARPRIVPAREAA